MHTRIRAPHGQEPGTRVQEAKVSAHVGTVVGAIGNQRWIVQFDDAEPGKTEEKASKGSLRIYIAAYGVVQTKTPIKTTARSVPAAVLNTIRNNKEHLQCNIDGDDSDRSSGGGAVTTM